MKKITATFQPQAYVNDQIIDIDGAVECDVTDYAATLDQEYIDKSRREGVDGNDVFASYLALGNADIKRHINYLPYVIKLEQDPDRYDWTGWDEEIDLGNADDRKGVYFLTIRDNEEELAIIVHRVTEKNPLDGDLANAKVLRAQDIVNALNATEE